MPDGAAAQGGVLLACGVFRAELESIAPTRWPDWRVVFLPSMLHMRPERLAAVLGAALTREVGVGRSVALVYGDCCPRMEVLEGGPGVARTRGKNCCELLLGPAEYSRLSHEGSFFLISEWVGRWREVFETELGLTREIAASLMLDVQRKLEYLDTGLVPVPEEALRQCSDYCGLPCELRTTSLEHLEAAIDDAVRRTEPDRA